jgi:putative zinc finger/helix-turn-helix YgiT family protein
MKKSNSHNVKSRPFPWRCPACLKGEVYPATIPYTIDVKHDGTLHSIHLPALEVPKCRACGELLFGIRADDQISEALRAQLKLLGPAQIRAARKALGLKQKELAELLGTAKATICRWETGGMIQSRAMDNLLRLFFESEEVRRLLRRRFEPDPPPPVNRVFNRIKAESCAVVEFSLRN